MTLEELISVTKSVGEIELYDQSYDFGSSYCYSEPLFKGRPEDIPYKFIKCNVVDMATTNHVLGVSINFKQNMESRVC